MSLKRGKCWLYLFVSLMVLASIIGRPIIACQTPSEVPESEEMACCKAQDSCHILPEERFKCCQRNSSAVEDETWGMVLPLKLRFNPPLFSCGDSFLASYPVQKLYYSCYILPKKWPARGRLPSKIFLLKSSLLI